MSSLIDDPNAARRHEEQPSITVTPHGAPTVDPRDDEIERLRRQLDEVTQQLLVARDAAVGADAERSVARARVSELEHHLHVREVEVEELTERLRTLSEADQRSPGTAETFGRRVESVGRRVADRLNERVAGR